MVFVGGAVYTQCLGYGTVGVPVRFRDRKSYRDLWSSLFYLCLLQEIDPMRTPTPSRVRVNTTSALSKGRKSQVFTPLIYEQTRGPWCHACRPRTCIASWGHRRSFSVLRGHRRTFSFPVYPHPLGTVDQVGACPRYTYSVLTKTDVRGFGSTDIVLYFNKMRILFFLPPRRRPR